ncbi:MAG: YeeE/YedE thiosulfate transporter family protein [Halanaerobacter sp.]
MSGRLQSLKQIKEILKKVFVRPWPYWVGGVLLALVNIIYISLTGEYWAITTGFARLGAWFLENLGVNVQEWTVWGYYEYLKPWQDRYTWSNLGIISGALAAILIAGQFKWKKLKDKKQFFIALGGGWLMGYGARIAIGCNIGGLYSSISSLALNGWLYLPFIILGILLGSKLLQRWFV